MRSDFYAILHRISEKLVFDLPVQKVRFRAPLVSRAVKAMQEGPVRHEIFNRGNGVIYASQKLIIHFIQLKIKNELAYTLNLLSKGAIESA